VQVLENGQVSFIGCGRAREHTPNKVVLSRPLQQSQTPQLSSAVTYGPRSFTKKSNDSLVGQRQSFVVVQQAYDTRNPHVFLTHVFIHVRERVEVEPERVRSGSLGGVPPRLTHQREVDAGLDALHVGEDHGRDIQVWIEGWSIRIERLYAVTELHGEAVRGRVLVRRGFSSDAVLFFQLTNWSDLNRQRQPNPLTRASALGPPR